MTHAHVCDNCTKPNRPMTSLKYRTQARSFQYVKCLRCHHVWDDNDPTDYVCACILNHGNRTVVVLSEGATNTPKTMPVA